MPLLASSKYLWNVWRASTRASLVREMEFRGNFVAGLIRQGIWLLIFVLVVEVVFQNTNSLAGWDKPQVLVIIALSRMIEGLMNSLFAQNIMELPGLVQEGKFDFHLAKPTPSQFYTAFRRTGIDNLGNIIAGIFLFIYAVGLQPALPSISSALLFIILAVCGITIYYSLLITASTLVFILDRLEFLWGFHMLMSEPFTVPFDIFPRTGQIALTYLLPLAFVVFVPAQAITGKLALWQVPVALVLTGVFLLIANLAWRAGLRRYSSASS